MRNIALKYTSANIVYFSKEKRQQPSGYRFGQIKKCDGPISSEASNPSNVFMSSQPGNQPKPNEALKGAPKQFYRSFQSGMILTFYNNYFFKETFESHI